MCLLFLLSCFSPALALEGRECEQGGALSLSSLWGHWGKALGKPTPHIHSHTFPCSRESSKFVFWVRVSLGSSVWPRTHYVDHAGLTRIEICLHAFDPDSWVLGLNLNYGMVPITIADGRCLTALILLDEIWNVRCVYVTFLPDFPPDSVC